MYLFCHSLVVSYTAKNYDSAVRLCHFVEVHADSLHGAVVLATSRRLRAASN